MKTTTKSQLLPFSWLVNQCDIWSRRHLATFHFQKVWYQTQESPRVWKLPGLWLCYHPSTVSFLHFPRPGTTCCSWTSVHPFPCGLLLIRNSHGWQTAPADMTLWKSTRPFGFPLLFRVGHRNNLTLLIINEYFLYPCCSENFFSPFFQRFIDQ